MTRPDAIGRVFPPVTYAVGREKIREYAGAVGETSPLHTDLDAARAAGYGDLVAPPMFVVVYTSPAIGATSARRATFSSASASSAPRRWCL